MRTLKPLSIPILCVLATLLLSACGDDRPQGFISLAVTDAPVDGATAVVVAFTGVELQHADGERITIIYDEPRAIDLLALQGGLSEPLLDGTLVPAGAYAWIRLLVDAPRDGTGSSYITLLDGTTHDLYVPSGAESGLKLHGGVAVAAGGQSDFTVDFDLRSSVHAPQDGSGDHVLRPTLRLVDNQTVGGIAGSVDMALLVPGCTPAVYAYAGTVTPDDLGGAGADPLNSVLVDVGAESASYLIGMLAPGAYTVAFTCGAAADAPDVDDPIEFAPVAGATVTAGATTTVDFVAAPPP